MKKITFLLLSFLAVVTLNAQTLLTGSDTPDIIDGGVFCGAGDIQDLNGFRSYVLADFGITEDFQITTVQYGAGAGSLAGAPAEGLPVTITIYTTDAPFPTGTLTEIATTTDVLFDGDGGIVRDVAIDALIPAGSEVVIGTLYPNDGITNVTIGSGGLNTGGQISWISSVGCLGDDVPVDLAGFGLTNAWIINAIGDVALSVEDNRSLGEASIQFTSITGQTVMEQTIDAIGTSTLNTSRLSSGIYFAQIATEDASTVIKFIKN